MGIGLVSFTRSLATSSAKIALRGFEYALSYLPGSPSGTRTSRSTDDALAGEWRSDAEPGSPNGSWDPFATVIGDEGDEAAATGEELDSEVALAEDAAAEGGDEWSLGDEPSRERVVAVPTPSRSTLDADVEELRFIRLKDSATLPTRAHDGDAGLDLYAAEGARIGPGERVSVGTGLAVAIPPGLAGLVLPRSGLALKHGIALVNSPGLIDAGYRGEVRVLLLNTDRGSDFRVSAGDRIAQLVLVPIATATPLEADELDQSIRGGGGFGSSGP